MVAKMLSASSFSAFLINEELLADFFPEVQVNLTSQTQHTHIFQVNLVKCYSVCSLLCRVTKTAVG